MSELITIDAAKAGAQFAVAVRQARALVADCTDDIVRDLLQVQAGHKLAAALGPEICALIIAAGKQGHYELVEVREHIPPEKIVEVVVKAYLSGLQLCGQQFAVFGQRDGAASLYIKSNGYRHRFATSGRAGVVRCQVGYPNIVPLATAGETKGKRENEDRGKAVALMTGTASVKWDGELITVEAPEAYRIGIPCYGSDNIDGLQAKAERRLLKQLWTACTGVLEADAETDGAVTVDVVTDVASEPAETTPAGRDWETERKAYREEWELIADVVKPLYAAIMQANTGEELDAAFGRTVSVKMSAKDREAFIRAVTWQRERLGAS